MLIRRLLALLLRRRPATVAVVPPAGSLGSPVYVSGRVWRKLQSGEMRLRDAFPTPLQSDDHDEDCGLLPGGTHSFHAVTCADPMRCHEALGGIVRDVTPCARCGPYCNCPAGALQAASSSCADCDRPGVCAVVLPGTRPCDYEAREARLRAIFAAPLQSDDCAPEGVVLLDHVHLWSSWQSVHDLHRGLVERRACQCGAVEYRPATTLQR